MNLNLIHLLYKGEPPGNHMSDREKSNAIFESEMRAERPMNGTEMYRCKTETLKHDFMLDRKNERAHHKKGEMK